MKNASLPSFPGVTGVQVEELYSLGKDQFESLKPVHGLIFLFKWVKDDSPAGDVVKDSRAEKMFFAKQVGKESGKKVIEEYGAYIYGCQMTLRFARYKCPLGCLFVCRLLVSMSVTL